MQLKPVGDRLVVEPMVEDEVSKAGIILPDTIDKDRPEKGRVVAVGRGRTLENGQLSPLEVKTGDIVVFKKYAPDELKVDGKEFFILSEADVMAILE